MLVAFFIFFYILDSIFTFYITAFVQSHLWVIHVSYILNSCFPTVCLILLIFRDPRTPSFCFWIVKDKCVSTCIQDSFNNNHDNSAQNHLVNVNSYHEIHNDLRSLIWLQGCTERFDSL
jgi:hypothetical protein